MYNILEWPVEQLLYKKWRDMLWKEITGPRVLEVGVGTGKNLPYYSSGMQVFAIDLSPGMLGQAEKKVERMKIGDTVTLLEMDAQALEFGDESFDEVVATFAFCSIPDPVLGFEEALRVTKPGGRLHLLEHMLIRNSRLASVMEMLDGAVHWVTGVHIARKTVRNVKKAGWTIEQAEKLTPGGIFRKIRAVKQA